ncbi:MAG: peptidoglycan-binding domain-containing protein [Candidatus Falkowbacteria bacterium]
MTITTFNKALLLIAVCLLLAVFLPSAHAVHAQVASDNVTAAGFQADLELGDEGADVLALQKLLIKSGYLKITKPSPVYGYKPNGYYGEQTKAAVAKWQKSKGIKASGVFGPISRAKANLGYLAIANRETAATSSGTSTPAVSNGRLIAANTCTAWTYTDWSACSSWGNQTRSIVFAYPSGCAGGAFVLAQACGANATSTATSTAETVVVSAQPSIGTFHPSQQSLTLDDRLLSVAFSENGLKVGLTCKPWVSKVVAVATDQTLALPTTSDNNYTWKNNANGRVQTRDHSIQNTGRGDIIQMNMLKNDLPHTAIVVSATPAGMVWIHSNWQTKKTVSVDFITYAYFNATFGPDYSVYHLQ